MGQPNLFDETCRHTRVESQGGNSLRCLDCGAWVTSVAEAERRKRDGIDRVMEHEAEEWKTRALACAYRVARRLREFTVEDIRLEMVADGLMAPHHPNAIGGLFHAIKGEMIAVATDRTMNATHPESHGRSVRIWRSLL